VSYGTCDVYVYINAVVNNVMFIGMSMAVCWMWPGTS